MILQTVAMWIILDNAIHSAFPRETNSSTFCLPEPYISSEILAWYEQVKLAAKSRGPYPLSSLKQNFGGLLGIYPYDHDTDLCKMFFHADCVANMPGSTWTFKRLVPVIAQEKIDIDVAEGMFGNAKEEKVSMPGRQQLVFNTRRQV